MKRTSLVGGALAATAITLFSIAGSSANPAPAVLPKQNYVEATFAARFPVAGPNLVLALSDLVDVERMIREASAEERARHQTAISIPTLQDRVG
ncbi:hypothetical protein [Devosia psychrophila]|nr:hypothetical protein [Devosia psychrophila]